jgi:hypothetical protein
MGAVAERLVIHRSPPEARRPLDHQPRVHCARLARGQGVVAADAACSNRAELIRSGRHHASRGTAPSPSDRPHRATQSPGKAPVCAGALPLRRMTLLVRLSGAEGLYIGQQICPVIDPE